MIDAHRRLLAGRTILIGPGKEEPGLEQSLTREGARVISLPEVQICEPQNFYALDEAIESLFGYDWIIFRNIHAVEYFLRRFHQLGHETHELDSLRILAVEGAASDTLSSSQVHTDLVVAGETEDAPVTTLRSYLGEQGAIARLNFLNICAANSREMLSERLEELDARVDTVVAYRTVARESSALAQLGALLAGGGIDCFAIQKRGDLEQLAELFDTGDMGRLLAPLRAVCLSDELASDATNFGITGPVSSDQKTIQSLTNTIINCLVSPVRSL